MRQSIFLFTIILMFSCGQAPESEPAATESEVPQQAQASLSSLTEYQIDGAIALPDISRTGVLPTITLNEITGMLDVHVGKGFHILMREEEQELESLKKEWSLDPVWSHSVVKEGPDHVLYSKTLPDGSMPQFHFISLSKNDGRSMLIRSADMEEFSQEEAELMLNSAQTFTWNSALAQMNTNE